MYQKQHHHWPFIAASIPSVCVLTRIVEAACAQFMATAELRRSQIVAAAAAADGSVCLFALSFHCWSQRADGQLV